jgi:hypothetical protein
MLSRNPGLTPRQIDSLLQTTAIDIEAAGRDTLSGAGRIDAFAAVNAMSEGAKWAQLWVINQATATGILRVTDITQDEGEPWIISVSPKDFSVPINDSQAVNVTVDTVGQGLQWGQVYHDTLLLWSNSVLRDNPERVPVRLIMAIVGVEEDDEHIRTQGSQLLSISPNPFNKKVDIKFNIAREAKNMEIQIYDVTGRLIKSFDQLANDQVPISQITWNGTDNNGRKVSSGIYFCRLIAEKKTLTNKLIFLR